MLKGTSQSHLFIHLIVGVLGYDVVSQQHANLCSWGQWGSRESRPFHEEPETSVSILISTTVLHSALPAQPQLATGQESSICWRLKKERNIQMSISHCQSVICQRLNSRVAACSHSLIWVYTF